ncbi:MAG: hypothetical protein P4L27_03965 [Ignavibacteriaceae bacterium]|nr:hypothetical protein [Ignavibacteriaceae bacterium]
MRIGDLKLVGLNSLVKNMFQQTKMSKVLKSFDSKDEAINSFS